ncbi:MAG TPA: response regulator [Anaerohalosphaeraceae bacterium]|nr:response regulator [Anaerohalosphaeraceae bacterium]HRT49311.1 response regulator [Anaerohalosphaeraceae bacterium]HRT85960.1 response regulator [Anaerohalosphaeraceae bacterium]
MNQDVVILIAEDDEGHFSLIRKNLVRSGIFNEVIRFTDGQEVLDFLFDKARAAEPQAYILILDTQMPKVDGVTVLERIKAHEALKRIPVVMLAADDDPHEVEHCHELGCSIYIVKPAEHDDFVDAIRKVGQFFSVVSVPRIGE